LKAIQKQNFAPTPSKDACKYCSYIDICEDVSPSVITKDFENKKDL
jgi:hypothetical protein